MLGWGGSGVWGLCPSVPSLTLEQLCLSSPLPARRSVIPCPALLPPLSPPHNMGLVGTTLGAPGLL